jgi:hypothetical protein
MSSSNAEYFARRSEQERKAAQTTSDPQIAAVHAQMAELYEAAVSAAAGELRIPVQLVPGRAIA